MIRFVIVVSISAMISVAHWVDSAPLAAGRADMLMHPPDHAPQAEHPPRKDIVGKRASAVLEGTV
ncbi:MAG: hypothetical protein HUJ27_10560 [Rhodobacteraceae bacterium]|nr:hypothetical protein [Paracoccaceae bacterium]